MDKEEREIFLKNLLKKKNEHKVLVFLKYYKDDIDMEPDTLMNMLSLDESLLNEGGKILVQYLENLPQEEKQLISYNNFKWKLSAFLSIQDVFDMKIQPDLSHINQEYLFQLRYFYYESKYILTESIITGLNGSHIGNKHLMRSFLEFNLLQNYFTRENERRQSFKPVNDYFEKGITPSFSKLVDKALPNDSFCKPIKKRFQSEFNNLSGLYSHTYDPKNSPKHSGAFQPGNTVESIYFWIHWSLVLEMVLWLYFVNYPTLFYPVDILKKFGFNPPMGLFVDESVGRIIRMAIPKEDFDLFKSYANQQSTVQDIMNFYESQNDMTEEEIWATWTEEERPSTLEEAHVLNCVKSRVLQESLSVNRIAEEELTELDEKVRMHLESFTNWTKIYKKL